MEAQTSQGRGPFFQIEPLKAGRSTPPGLLAPSWTTPTAVRRMRRGALPRTRVSAQLFTADPQTLNLEFQGFDSVRVLRGGNLRSMGDFPGVQTQRFLVCGSLVCGLAVLGESPFTPLVEVSRRLANRSRCSLLECHGRRQFSPGTVASRSRSPQQAWVPVKPGILGLLEPVRSFLHQGRKRSMLHAYAQCT